MDENNKNFLVAIVLSVMVFLVWNYFYIAPKQEKLRERQLAEAQLKEKNGTANAPLTDGKIAPQTPGLATSAALKPKSRDEALADSERVKILTPSIRGSINLVGGRIDDVLLRKHRETVDRKSPPVELFSPDRSAHPYFVDFGWSSSNAEGYNLPKGDSAWKKIKGDVLTPEAPVTLQYDAGNGLSFEREISIDDQYMFTVVQRVTNKGAKAVDLAPYGLIYRRNKPLTQSIFISHEGAVGIFDGTVEEVKYSALLEDKKVSYRAKTGWLSLTDKYWAAALIPDKAFGLQATFIGDGVEANDTYQANYLLTGQRVEPGQSVEITNRLFAGAKQGRLIESYAETLNIDRFENLIDWGWFHFITKPMFHVLAYFNDLIGNFGVAILIVTVLVKLLLFPLANKSYKSMAQMKKMQPQMEKIRDRYKEDKMKQQQELMELYKKEKINPVSGCWPVLVQIPIFFALYKVLYVTIEMRHAPFIGWIQDLSAPDPTSLFNLFGLIPIDLPQFLMIGIWPIIMGITMFVQMKLNPAPADPVQAQIFTYMPIIFTFILAGFSAGLVIYWAWNNTLSILQQYYIMRRNGVSVNLLENMGFKKSKDSKAS